MGYLGPVHDPARARKIAAAAMEEAAPIRASAVDLVNVALEELVRAGPELPGFSTLDRMAASVRTRVESEICARIAERVGQARDRLVGLLIVPDGERRSPFDQVKEPGRRTAALSVGPALREQIQKATNKAEANNGFTKWLHFGNAGWLASRDPELQDKAVKFLDLVAASVVFSTTIDMTWTLQRMAREGWTLNGTDLAVVSPYRRENVLRFGDYTTDQLHVPPPAYNPTLHAATDIAAPEPMARR